MRAQNHATLAKHALHKLPQLISIIANNYKILFFCTLFHQQTFQSLGSLSFKLLILVKKQEPEQASKCPWEYPKDRNNVYLHQGGPTLIRPISRDIKSCLLIVRANA